MVDSQVNALHLKTLTTTQADTQVNALHLKVLTTLPVKSQVDALHLKVLAQYPQPTLDGGDASGRQRRLRVRDRYTRSN